MPSGGLQKEIEFLAALEQGEVVSQHVLSRRVGVSVGLLNTLLKRAIRKGYVKTQSAPAKRWAYYLTPTGACEKGRLVAEYLEASFDLFRRARSELESILSRASNCGQKRVLLVGDGDLAEIAVLASQGSGVEIVGILSSTIEHPVYRGLKVLRSLDEALTFDLAVLTDMRTPQITYDRLCAQLGSEIIAVPPLLRISASATSVQEKSGALRS